MHDIDPIRHIDQAALSRDLAELEAELVSGTGAADLKHLRKMTWWSRLASAVGFATGWIAPNPLSAMALSLGVFTRWSIVAHHVCHGAYDRIADRPSHLDGRRFGRGWRRFVDWFDWMVPEAWHQEHDIDHHYNLGEAADPDAVDRNTAWLRDRSVPMSLRYVVLVAAACTWRFSYYAANTLNSLHTARERRGPRAAAVPVSMLHEEVWLPWYPRGRDLWLRSWLAYGLGRFVLLPALLWPFSHWAALSMAVNLVLGELLANLHSFVVIVSNHAGGDLYRFDRPAAGRAEFQLRQILGSVNFRCGGDWNDFLHGYLNYQIEHHLWPTLTLRQYQRAQPRLKAICARHGVPYVQESVWRRLRRLVAVIVGTEEPRLVDTRRPEPAFDLAPFTPATA